jgi:hypothetical protein
MAWTPADIDTELWLDASDEASVFRDGSDQVGQWLDKSGKNRNAEQGSTSLKPTYSGDLRGYPAIVTGSGYLKVANSTADFAFLHESECQTFIVADSENDGLGIIFGNNRTSSSGRGLFLALDNRSYYVGETPCYYFSVNRGISGTNTCQSHRDAPGRREFFPEYEAFIPNGTTLIWSHRQDLAQPVASDRVEIILFDGVSFGRGAGSDPAVTGAASYDLEVGAGGDGVQVGSSIIREIIILKTPLDGDIQTLMFGYLAEKWGQLDKLPSYHPARQQPATTPTQASKVSGTVQIDGTPAQRTVRAFGYNPTVHDLDGSTVNLSKSLGHSTSDPETGDYTIDLLAGYGQEIFVVAFDDYGAPFAPMATMAAGERVHPTTPNGHVWECIGTGSLPADEPTWIVDTESAQIYGTASMIARPFYRPMVHGPIAPEVTEGTEPVSWSPVELFVNGEVGVWYDPSDLTTMFQETTASVPVSDPGDPVAVMLDMSGSANHAIQSDAGRRPIYGAGGWIEPDGDDDHFESAFQLPLNGDFTVAFTFFLRSMPPMEQQIFSQYRGGHPGRFLVRLSPVGKEGMMDLFFGGSHTSGLSLTVQEKTVAFVKREGNTFKIKTSTSVEQTLSKQTALADTPLILYQLERSADVNGFSEKAGGILIINRATTADEDADIALNFIEASEV